MVYAHAILNAFSLNMVKEDETTSFTVFPAVEKEIVHLIGPETVSFVGHEDTARIFSKELGVGVCYNRANTTVKEGLYIVGQYKGPRLPEGATSLPNGATIAWFVVKVK